MTHSNSVINLAAAGSRNSAKTAAQNSCGCRGPSLRRSAAAGYVLLFALSVSCGTDGGNGSLEPEAQDLSGSWRGIIYEACDIPEKPDQEFVLVLAQADSVITGTAWINCGGSPESITSGEWKDGRLIFFRCHPEVDYEFSGSQPSANRLEGIYRILSNATGEYVHSASWYADRVQEGR